MQQHKVVQQVEQLDRKDMTLAKELLHLFGDSDDVSEEVHLSFP